MAINLDGVVFGMRAVLPGMRERGSGDIVATASMAGLGPIGQDPIYGLTKHGVVGLVRSIARWLEDTPNSPDICVSALCPGFTDTNILGEGAKEMIEAVGLEVMPAAHVGDTVMKMIEQRQQGSQWVVWPGIEPRVYEWNPAITEDEVGLT